jgi:MFS family permease
VSRIAPAEGRGVAIGVYNTTQTLGVALGGALGGWVAKHFGTAAVFGICTALSVLWLVVVAGMRPLPRPAARAVNGLSNAAL